MPFFCATIKLLCEDVDRDHASETIREAMNFLVEQNTIIDWGYSLQTPPHFTGVDGKTGPHPRLANTKEAQLYEDRALTIKDIEAQPEDRRSTDAKQYLVEMKEENEKLFHTL